jgi:hypothetical protein
MNTSTLVGNNLATDANGNSLGFLGQLGNFAGQVAPLVTAIKGTNGATAVGNPVNPGSGIPVTKQVSGVLGGIGLKTVAIFGGGLLLLVGAIFVLPNLIGKKRN